MDMATSIALLYGIKATTQPVSPSVFVQQRRAGAAKIAKEAKAKGGLATLTAIHFSAKLAIYDFIASAIDQPNLIETLKSMEASLAKKIAAAPDMTSFQEMTGRLEVYGEVILFLEHPQVYP
jgi:hypothetical protein